MSKVECRITDLDALEVALERLGGELRRGQTSFTYYAGSKSPCVHAIRVKGSDAQAYEVGLRQTEPGAASFDLACDFYSGQLTKAFGQNLTGIQNEYLAAVAEQRVRRSGYRVQRVEEGQRIRLVATK